MEVPRGIRQTGSQPQSARSLPDLPGSAVLMPGRWVEGAVGLQVTLGRLEWFGKEGGKEVGTGLFPETEAVCHQGGVRLRCWGAQGDAISDMLLGMAKGSILFPALFVTQQWGTGLSAERVMLEWVLWQSALPSSPEVSFLTGQSLAVTPGGSSLRVCSPAASPAVLLEPQRSGQGSAWSHDPRKHRGTAEPLGSSVPFDGQKHCPLLS